MPVRFNVGLLVEAGDGGGGKPVPAAAAGHNFFFFGAVGEGNIEVEVLEAGTGLLISGAMLGGGTFLLGYAPHALPITCGRRAAVEGKEGSG